MSAPRSAQRRAHATIPIAEAGVTRRDAMQLMAAAVALASGACTREPVERIYPYVTMPEAGRGALPAYYASAFVRDGHGTGILVGTREGRPIKIEGNPDHPSSVGGTDVFAQASVLDLWDPDRSQTVRRRAPGAASADASTPSTWREFEAAWRERGAMLEARRGRGLGVVMPRFTSPSSSAGLGAVLARFPEARWFRHSPSWPTAARRGALLAFGREIDTVLRFDRTSFILTLGSDPFSHVPGHLRHARDWAGSRAGTGAGERERELGAPSSVAVETGASLFGARADERRAMAPAAIDALVADIARALREEDRAATSGASTFAARLAAQLRSAGPAALIVAGADVSAQTHALVYAMLQQLGAFGQSLVAIDPLDAAMPQAPGTLAELVAAIDSGRIDTLLVCGGNPAYDAPGALELPAALARVPWSAHLGRYRDETARTCTWHLPASHDIESWGDVRGHDGTATIIQPAIAPLYDTRAAIEWLALIAGSELRDGHAIVRATWREQLGAAAPRNGAEDPRFASWWHTTLRAGMVAQSTAKPIALPAAREIDATPVVGASASPAALVAVFARDASIDCGEAANNAWLQELPRPFSSLTWDNAIQLGPKTAAGLGVATGDVVRVTANAPAIPGERARSIEAPVWVSAEHAEGAATLPLGYGRAATGRVGNGVGFDAYVLRDANDSPRPIALARTGKSHRFATTQRRFDQEGRDLARSVAAGTPFDAKGDQARPSLYPPVAYPEHAWAMAIDLDACIGCNACTIACQAENNIPTVGADEVARGREMHWIRVDRYPAEAGTTVFQPVPCMHCENAPCELVCPVGATVHDSEGLNVQVYNRCVGTRFCSNNCPYKVRRFNFLQYVDDTTETLKAMRNPDVTVRQRGVMEKCTYCLQRLSGARLDAERAGRAIADGDVQTACQSACPTRAIHFGDLVDRQSDVVRAKASPRHYALLGELNTRPRTTYLARVVPSPQPSPASGRGGDSELPLPLAGEGRGEGRR